MVLITPQVVVPLQPISSHRTGKYDRCVLFGCFHFKPPPLLSLSLHLTPLLSSPSYSSPLLSSAGVQQTVPVVSDNPKARFQLPPCSVPSLLPSPERGRGCVRSRPPREGHVPWRRTGRSRRRTTWPRPWHSHLTAPLYW
ncbi:hypothetical protein J4Q44_G00219780, partial [Coregonus suidteri]